MAIGRIAPDRRLFCIFAGLVRAPLNPRRKVRPGREGGQRPDPPSILTGGQERFHAPLCWDASALIPQSNAQRKRFREAREVIE